MRCALIRRNNNQRRRFSKLLPLPWNYRSNLSFPSRCVNVSLLSRSTIFDLSRLICLFQSLARNSHTFGERERHVQVIYITLARNPISIHICYYVLLCVVSILPVLISSRRSNVLSTRYFKVLVPIHISNSMILMKVISKVDSRIYGIFWDKVRWILETWVLNSPKGIRKHK